MRTCRCLKPYWVCVNKYTNRYRDVHPLRFLTNERAKRKQYELNEKKSLRSIKCMSESAHSTSYDSFYRFHFGRLSVPLSIQMDFWRNDPVVMKYFDLLFDYWRPVHFCRRRKSKTTRNFIRCQRAWSFRKRETNNS